MTRAGIFGWSYPPGCSGPPDDGPEPPCQVCGEYEEKCKCPECPVPTPHHSDPDRVCGTVGCLEHMDLQSLLQSEAHYSYLANARTREITRRSMAAGVTCDQCKRECPADIREGYPAWCDHCKAFAQKEHRDNEYM
jgi:hypothetical protein